MSNAQNRGPGATVVAGNTSGTPSQPVVTAAAAPVAAVDLVGTVLSDRYRVLKKLGEGGMGSVYLAEHTTINKKLAIKVLSPEYSHKQDLVDRFLQEARAASMIDQENVVEITDFGSTPSGSVFFVMEYLAGEDLAHTIRNVGPMPWERVKPIMLQICAALDAAHAAGIIHRDMKPENCFRISRRGNEDFIKVLDFGIAKVTSDDNEGGRALTRTGMIFGTPEYMSPEQAKGERVDHRVDVYAVGVILYELLTGRVPFTADTFMGILTQHMFEAPPAPSTIVPAAEIPPEVEAIILKALQKDREYRFQSMNEMAAAMRAVGTGAGAVSVVQENVATPTTGRIHFSTHSTGAPVVSADEDFAPRSRMGLFIGGAVVAIALVVGGAFAFTSLTDTDDGGETPSDEVAVVPDVTPTQPEPAEGGDEPDQRVEVEARTVAITIATPGVDGTIHDSRDNGLLGKTNEPLTLPVSSDPIGVYVKAEGYETELIQIVASHDKTIPTPLVKIAGQDENSGGKSGTTKTATRSKTKTTKTSGKTEKPATGPETKPEPKVETPKPKSDPEPKPKSTSSSPDLKDPFNNGK